MLNSFLPKPARLALAALVLSLDAGCVSPKVATSSSPELISGDATAPSQVTPAEALATAELYAHHPWQPFARNIEHGVDSQGVRVDTPDVAYHPPSGRNGWWVPGEINEGIPYKWGGFDNPMSFDQAISAGRAAGDVSTPAKRAADNTAVSSNAAGVDCSGFISRCLNLPVVYDTDHLPAICEPLPGPDQLKPGDLFNIPHRHVFMFAGWAKADHSWIYFYETGGIPEWKPALKQAPLAKMLALGYQPLRYRGMAHEAAPSGKEILTRAMRERAVVITDPAIGDP